MEKSDPKSLKTAMEIADRLDSLFKSTYLKSTNFKSKYNTSTKGSTHTKSNSNPESDTTKMNNVPFKRLSQAEKKKYVE